MVRAKDDSKEVKSSLQDYLARFTSIAMAFVSVSFLGGINWQC